MMVRMRNAAQSWIAKFVAGLLIVVLVLFGFGAFNLFGVDEPAVASVNGEDITERRLASEIERTKQNLRETYGDSVTDKQLDEFVDEAFALQRLIDGELFTQATRDLKLTMSDMQFERRLRNDPAFQTDGEFDEELLRAALARGGISAQALRGLEEDSTVRTQLLRALEDTAFTTNAETRLSAKFDKQVRDISTLAFHTEEFDDPDSVTREDVTAHYELNHDLYMTEGSFDFEYAEIKREQFLTDTELSDAEIQELFDAEIAALKSSAKRRGRHLLIKVDDNRSDADALTEIAAIRQRVMDGESLEALATELSEDAGSKSDGGDLGFSDRSQWVTEFSDSLWSLDVGEISAPVKTTFGYHLIELMEIEEIELPTLDARREDLIEEHRLELATTALKEAYEEVDKLAFEQSDSLLPIAEAYDVELQAIAGVDGSSADGIFTHSVVRTAFMSSDVIDNGFNSRVVEVGDEFITVGRMTDRMDPTLKPLDDVYEDIRAQLAEEAAKAARDAVHAEVYAKLLEDRDYDAAADATESSWLVYERQKRDDFRVDPAVLDVAFAQPLPVDDTKVITEALSEFTPTKFIVVVSRQALADFVLLEQAEQDTLNESAANGAKTRALSAFVSSLRSEASIQTDLYSLESNESQ